MDTNQVNIRFDEKEIDKIFASIDQGQAPGVAVGISINGAPVYRKGFGLASIELPTLLTPSIRMRIGSTTKHFAALAFMLLVEDGLAAIDDEIGKFVPEVHPANSRATIRQLMGHNSGLRDAMSIMMQMNGSGHPVSAREIISYYETIDSVDFDPGTRWVYNNGGYYLLGTAIERIVGEPLDDVLRKRIFEPVGMFSTMLRRWDSDFVANSATLHMIDSQGGFTRDYMGMELTAAGGVVSTADDMLLWLRHMDAPIVGSAETWRVMKAPHRLKNGTSTGYGLGLITDTYRGVETLSHGGGVMGGNSQMIKVPAAGLDITIAANRSDVRSPTLALQIIDACVEGLEPVQEPTAFKRRSGTFLSAATGQVIELSDQAEMQLMSLNGASPMPIVPDADGIMRLPGELSMIKYSLSVGGDAVRFSDFGSIDELREIDLETDARIGKFAGRYRAEPFHTTLEIFDQGDQGARLKTTGLHGSMEYSLVPLTALIWRAEGLGPFSVIRGMITFAEDSKTLVFRGGMMDRVQFEREE